MLPLLGIALVVTQQVQVQVGTPASRQTPIVRDSSNDSISAKGRGDRGVRRPVTAEDQRTAFKDATAKATLLNARVARMRQDSSLTAYDAMSYQRISAGLGFRAIGRDRLLFRHESAARVRWQQNVGVWMEARGRRTAIPMVTNDEAKKEIREEADVDPDMSGSIPYFPGYEPLWVGGDVARAQVNEQEIVNPIADGAEAYYTYETGDSIRFTLPNKTVIQLREIRVRPRQPKWNLAVGSLWFDSKSGQLVRAAYRLSIPMDIWAVAKENDSTSMDDVPKWVKPMITPMKAEVSAIAVEYGLYEGRFWLPRTRLAEGSAQVSFMHVPFKMEESFKYASVNAKDSLPPIVGEPSPYAGMPDSLSERDKEHWRDSVRTLRREHARAVRDSVRRGLREPDPSVCDTADTRVRMSRRYDSQIPVAVSVPCDISKLENSPDLPPSIYDPGDELFGGKELEALKAEALSLSAQAPLQFRLGMLPRPSVQYGPSLMRYNRVEGLSLGASVEQQLGGGYSASALGRFGFADLEPNIELRAKRSNVTTTVGFGAYNHLVSASDWGQPLSFSSSFSALLFGRDEGFYYRSTGVELTGTRASAFLGGSHVEWRLFAEQERNAAVETDFSFAGDFTGNLTARRGTYAGGGLRVQRDFGLDPAGLRVFTDLRLESAVSDSAYGRGALDITVSHGLGRHLAAALTASGGSSVGALPPQRFWYLGGSQTVRGQSPDTLQRGNAFWLGRAELGARDAGIRPAIFADMGWVGDRTRMSEVGRPMSGVGAGVSFLDGLFRFDVARGLYPRKQTRVDLYLESKF